MVIKIRKLRKITVRNKIAVIGSGTVGLVVAGSLAAAGYKTTCIDPSPDKVARLSRAQMPINEPGLADLIAGALSKGQLRFETSLSAAVSQCDVIFLDVGLPSDRDGNLMVDDLCAVARSIGLAMDNYKIIINKSTVPVGTARALEQIIRESQQARNTAYPFDVVANPDFLSEGSALQDFRHPRQVIFGIINARAAKILRLLYRYYGWPQASLVVTNPETAEMIKLAANAFMDMKSAFINEIASLCEIMGADIVQVARGIGMDDRVGLHSFKPGHEESCFSREARALARQAKEAGRPLKLVEAVIAVHGKQSNLV